MIVVDLIISLFVIVLLQFAGMYIFSLMTPYRDMEEINNGNVAVGIYGRQVHSYGYHSRHCCLYEFLHLAYELMVCGRVRMLNSLILGF